MPAPTTAEIEVFCRRALAEHPNLTVLDLARDLEKEGLAISLDTLRAVRARLRQERPAIPDVTLPAAVQNVITGPTCSRCGGPHWISQCHVIPEAPPANDDVPPPITPEEPTTMTATEAAPPPLPSPPKVVAPDDVGRLRNLEGTMRRRKRLNELLDVDPGAEPSRLIATLKEQYGVALDTGYVYETCRVARELHKLPAIPFGPSGYAKADAERGALPTFAGTETPSLDEELVYLAQRIAETVRAHNLAEIQIVLEAGDINCEYAVRRTGRLSVPVGK